MKIIAIILIIIFLSGCTSDTKKVTFKTDDGFEIHSNFYEPENPKGKAIILLHMLKGDKSDWYKFAQRLKERGYHVLAIDLRGHGDSIFKNGKKIVLNQLSESDFKNMVLDVKAAKLFLIQAGINEKNIGIIGTSIGANVALNYAATDEEIRVIALLSPELNYKGVTVEEAIKNYDRPIFIAASRQDEITASIKLYEMALGKKTFKIYEDATYGSRIFENIVLQNELISWLEEVF